MSDVNMKIASMIAPGGFERWINGELLGPKKKTMKEVTNKEIRDIAEGIVSTTNESSNDYDAVDDVTNILKEMFIKMNIEVEKIKNNPDCKCTNCECNK